MIDVPQIELRKFKNNDAAKGLYDKGIDLLRSSGIFEFLRVFARPFSPDRGANPHTASYTAAFCEGYHKALDDIYYFKEMFLEEATSQKQIRATFGALGLAVAKGDLTLEEAQKYGTGNSRKGS